MFKTTHTGEVTQPTKNERGAVFVVEIILVALLLVVAGFAAYRYFGHKNEFNRAAVPKPHLAAQASPSPSSTTRKTVVESADGAVSVILPSNWKVSSLSANFTSIATGQCDSSTRIAPTDYTGESRWAVTFCKSKLSPKEWSERPLGSPSTNFVSQNESSINGYSSFYVKVLNNSYTDLNYFIGAEGYIAYLYARESATHYSPQGIVDQRDDLSRYTPAFLEIVNSIKIQ